MFAKRTVSLHSAFSAAVCLLLLLSFLSNIVHCQASDMTKHDVAQLSVTMDQAGGGTDSSQEDSVQCDNVCHVCTFMPVQADGLQPTSFAVFSSGLIADERCPDGLAKAIDHPPQIV
jgi:hypothetical protein